MNTIINYLYRSNSNYKNHNEVIVKGVPTDEQIQKIMNSLIDGTNFIPEMIGLSLDRGWEYEEDEDNDFAELNNGAESFEPTDKPATEDITIEELVARFEAAIW